MVTKAKSKATAEQQSPSPEGEDTASDPRVDSPVDTAVKSTGEPALQWIDAGEGYHLALQNNKVVCRNAKGKVLATVPASLKDSEAATDLRGLAEWLAGHDKECRERVDAWMLRSLPVPSAVLCSVWPDPSWQQALRDCVVVQLVEGKPNHDSVGLLRDAADGSIGVVDLDGNTKRWLCDQVLIPHPVLLHELDDWREFTAELGVNQLVPQLFRETFAKPALDDSLISVSTYANGKYAQLRHVQGRASSHGYGVSGGFAVCKVFETVSAGSPDPKGTGEGVLQQTVMVEARMWIGSDAPENETETGDLYWVDAEGNQLKGSAIGPVAWSEGNRMGADLFAGRVIEKEEGQ
jgi:hypothetical protein